jgi:hypothetical protein
MSPEEFVLEIRLSDDLGYMEIEAQLHRYQSAAVPNTGLSICVAGLRCNQKRFGRSFHASKRIQVKRSKVI